MDSRASLLIVDDERGPTESLRMIFKPQYDVYTAAGGEEALAILAQSPIDVVTLDLRMPGMPGTEVLEHIKRLDADIEIIVITGYASLNSAIRGLRHRIFDYVTKPFAVPHIVDLVQRAVARRNATLRTRRNNEDFLANLSHELRTPLSAIIGYNSILTEELHARLNDDQRSAFDRIRINSQNLLALIETVLLLNSLDAGELHLSVSHFDVREMLLQTHRQFEPIARQRGLALCVEGDVAPLWVHTDARKLEHVIWALIDNAIKFTPHGSIALSARPTGDEGTFEVGIRDTGVNIHEADLAHLACETHALPLLSGSRLLPSQGLGLGLRMARRLTEFLGGHLRVLSVGGLGTQFTIGLPRHSLAIRHGVTHDA